LPVERFEAGGGVGQTRRPGGEMTEGCVEVGLEFGGVRRSGG
jgi:hypothetical protein